MRDSFRPLDLGAAVAGLVLLAPLFAVAAIWVKLDSPGPVFYRARRVGKGEREFRAFKFRSMTVGSDRAGPGITVANDARVTRSGRFLRRTKIDELPQLLNVLRGEMGLVGPRPEDPRYVARYTPEQRELLRVRPGMTSPASLRYRREESVLTGPDWEEAYLGEVLPRKLALDLEYVRSRSSTSDLALVVRTLAALLLPRAESVA